MIIYTNVSYPPERAKEIAERFMKTPQIPEYMTRKGPYINSIIEGGIYISPYMNLTNPDWLRD
jgi:hypothetical protein